MACKDCNNIDNLDCGCEEQHCNCKIQLSTVCILYEGVYLSVIDTYDGDNLESILLKIDTIFKDIFDIIDSTAYKNLGTGAEIFKRITSNRIIEFRTILGDSSVKVEQNLNDIGISLNEQWLYNFILNSDIETITNISNTVTGKRIATYTNESGVSQNINETVTSLVDNNNGSFTYTNENGVAVSYYVSSTQTQTNITNTIIGKRIGTYTNEAGNTKDINETVTSLSNTSLNTFQYTNENGVVTTYAPANATTANKGIVERATQTETDGGTDDERFITPKTFLSSLATETKTGVLEIATQAEANALSLNNRIVTPARLPLASTTQKGIAEAATEAEANAGIDSTRFITPATLSSVISSSNILSNSYETTLISWSRYSNIILNHGLGSAPKLVQVTLVAKNTSGGYEVGEEISVENIDTSRPDSPQWMGIRHSFTSTQVKIRIGNFVVVPIGSQADRDLPDNSADYSIRVRAYA